MQKRNLGWIGAGGWSEVQGGRKEPVNINIVPVESLLGVGLYTVPEAARLLTYEVGAPLSGKKLRRWAGGYPYKSGELIREAAPIVGRRLSSYDLFTFGELIELLVIGAFRRQGVTAPMIRKARAEAEIMFGSNPFSRHKFETNGKQIFVTLAKDETFEDPEAKSFTLELSRRQGAFDQVVRPLFRKIDFIDDMAGRFWPMDRGHSVVIDPERSFGRPIDNESGVPTAALYGMHKAGESTKAIAEWYRVSVEGVRDAIEYESALAKAA